MRKISILTFGLLFVCGGTLYSHHITVDGDPSDWIGIPPPTDSFHISELEGIWTDAIGDDSGDGGDAPGALDNPEPYSYPTGSEFLGTEADVTELRITADPTEDMIYFLFRNAGFDDNSIPLLGVCLDIDHVKGSGQEWLPLYADTKVDSANFWEYTVLLRNGGVLVMNQSWQDVTSPSDIGWFNPTDSLIEVGVKVSGWTPSPWGKTVYLTAFAGLLQGNDYREVDSIATLTQGGGGIPGWPDPDIYDLCFVKSADQMNDLNNYTDTDPAVIRATTVQAVEMDSIGITVDTIKPKLVYATATGWNAIDVWYSESMDSLSATSPSNYGLDPYLPIDSVSYLWNDHFRLNIGSLKGIETGVNYGLEVDTLVTDVSGNPIDTLYNSATIGIAQITFLVADTIGQDYPGFFLKGTWDTLDPHSYAPWSAPETGPDSLYFLYDDGTHGDETPGDHIWSRALNMCADGGAHTWEWGTTDTLGSWIAGNWQFWVSDANPQTLTFEPDPAISQEVQVTFSVDMGGQDPASYEGGVSLEGSRWPLDWDGGNTPLSDPDNDSIYTVTITFPIGTYPWVEYKYTKSTDGSIWDWESIDNRSFKIDDSNPTQTLPLDCFNNECPVSDTAVTVVFTYNCAAWADSIQHGVWLVGSQPPLSFGDPCPDTSNPMNDMGDWIYQLSVTFPKGTQKYVEFKAVIDADTSCWNEAELAGWNRHFIIDDSDTLQILDTLYYNDETLPSEQFIRADANADSSVGMPDAVYTLRYKFVPGSPPPPCMDAADANDDGSVGMPDAVYTLRYKFVPGSPPPPPPFPGCGPDPTDDGLDCGSHPCMGSKLQSERSSSKPKIGRLALGEGRVTGRRVLVPVYLSSIEPLSAFAFMVEYDPSLLTVIEVENKDLVTQSFDFFSGRPDEETGSLSIGGLVSFNFSRSLPSGSYRIANILFELDSGKLPYDVELSVTGSELIDTDGRVMGAQTVDGVVKAEFKESTVFALKQNYPNPAKGWSVIRYQLPTSAHTTLIIYNSAGQLIRTLVDEPEEPGFYTIMWDGKDGLGRQVSSGLYFYRLSAGSYSATRKMVVIE